MEPLRDYESKDSRFESYGIAIRDIAMSQVNSRRHSYIYVTFA